MDAVISDKQNYLRTSLDWVRGHPTATEFGAAAAFATLSHFSHDIPALFLFSSGMFASELVGIFASASSSSIKEHIIARGGCFVAGAGFTLISSGSIIANNSLPDIDNKLSQIAGTCPAAQKEILISTPPQDGFTSDQLALKATVTAVDYNTINTNHVVDGDKTGSFTTANNAGYGFRVAGNYAAKNFWKPGYSLRPYNVTFTNIHADNCRRDLTTPPATLTAAQPG